MPPNADWEEVAQQRAVDKNTHVSFPQLKYPSLRDDGLRDPVQWLAGKAMDDGAEGLWRIHDKLYDLTRFIKRHPGGEEWLELTQGTDITEAFESHHLNPSTEKILTQYYIRDAKTPRNSPFTFKEDGFYKTLKRAAFEELKKIPKDASRSANNITDCLFVSLLVSSAMACWVTNNYAMKFWYTYASLNLAVLTVACHNYIHRKTNWRMYLFNMSMWSYRFLSIFLYQGFFKSHYRWHDAIGLLLPLWMAIASDAPLLDVISMWLWINCTGSLIFFSIAVNAAHHHPDAIKDGDQPANETPDWGMHQVEALLDRKDVNGNVFAVMTLFGDHCLHHMFPTLDHSVLKYMHTLFIDLCEKYQANYRVSTQFKLVLGQIKETMRTEFRVKND
ncbi:cytochrome b5-related protein isoform X3 [Spodoptera frugiperda]|uniref:Cytochrome b5-related protein n=1 Tax=Spodoptera frugiperda TaxID=7108 RepID=A0A9R0EJS8_SPOFR|nr:cytochrome b5-related protein isoform X3 [Spodoptera frugiperda]